MVEVFFPKMMLRLVFKIMLPRWRSQPIKSIAQHHLENPSKQDTTLIEISQDDSITLENAFELFGNIDQRFIDFKMDRIDMLTLFLALESK